MEQREIEIAIGELEERVDRLRALYEQYFLGFEKLEPSVPRKDVDRRFAALRKENIRNTALRFRFNVVVQKYNTYAMHWTRTCRQIEEGTFKRHVRRAKERFGDAKPSKAREDAALEVDIDFEDLEKVDLETLLEEADRAASSFERPPADTVPPAAPAPVRAPAPSSSGGERVARPAPLPAGMAGKPKLVRKIAKAPDAPPSAPTAPAPSSVRLPGPPPSAPGLPARPPAPSAGRIPAPAPAPSAGRVPAAPPAPSTGRIPVPPPASAPGIPARPIIRPVARPPAPSQPELPPDRSSQTNPAAPPRPRPPPPLPSQVKRDEKK